MSNRVGQDNNAGGNTAFVPQTPATAKRHSEFYFDDSLVVLMVEDTLFRVHKYQLMKSEVFSDMFKMIKPSEGPEEGSCPENPIVLSGVAASDFECLLRMLYATYFSARRPEPDASLIVPAFRLANKWNFEDLRAYILPLAEKELGDIDKIVFAREFGIKEWLAPAHLKLCQRERPLTTEEAVKLGVHSLLLISRLRDGMQALAPGTYTCHLCAGYHIYINNSNYRCRKCTGYNYVLTPNLAFVNASNGANGVSIEATIEKWVADGCIFTE
ncbi:hypothetical protein FRC08_003057 [Ceratobasidium sp. 394]|nr:hypothetical protein FRC08_003057 [Ceratobasidium sp. 394]